MSNASGEYQSLESRCADFGAQVAQFLQRYLNQWQGYKPAWNYEDGCVWKASLDLADATGLRFFSDFVYREVSRRISADGTIARYSADEFNIDNVNPGVVLLALWRESEESRFLTAAEHQLAQLDQHPRTNSGGFWHKRIYPDQIWLDGLYMAQPLRAAQAVRLGDESIVADLLAQFAHVHTHLVDADSGLLVHGWDERRSERWSDPLSGRSPHVWARALGWYAMALIDCIDHLSANFPTAAAQLASSLQQFATTISAHRSQRGMWLQLPLFVDLEGNYEEASATLMIAYALMKGARLGVLAAPFGVIGETALRACIDQYLDTEKLNGICGVAGLGNTPYRDGSIAYYLSEPIVANDPKGVAALMMALAEGIRRVS